MSNALQNLPHPLALSPLHGEGEKSSLFLAPFPYAVGEGLGMGVLVDMRLIPIKGGYYEKRF